MISQNLEKTLHRAMTFAADRGSELVTLEHLLFALVDDQDASELLIACSINLDKLKNDLLEFFVNTIDSQSSNNSLDIQPTVSFQRVLQSFFLENNNHSLFVYFCDTFFMKCQIKKTLSTKLDFTKKTEIN